jgi:hypothetical protein
MFSKILLPGRKAPCSSETKRHKTADNRFTISFEHILYTTEQRLIGLNLSKEHGSGTFGIKTRKEAVEYLENAVPAKKIPECLDQVCLNKIPTMLEETISKSIWARAAINRNIKQGIFNFLLRRAPT